MTIFLLYLHLWYGVVWQLFLIELLPKHAVHSSVGHTPSTTHTLLTIRFGRPLQLQDGVVCVLVTL